MPTSATLFDAIAAGDRPAVHSLIAVDPSIATTPNGQGQSPLLVALYHHQNAIADDLLETIPAESLSIHEAAAAGALDRLAHLLESDPSTVNAWAADGFAPLALAAFFGRPEAVDLLLRHGADVTAAARNPSGVTALHAALAGPRPDIARRLVAAGADVNAHQQRGYVPLHTTAQNGSTELSQLLLDHGADAQVATEDGQTPADVARAAGHLELAEYLTRA